MENNKYNNGKIYKIITENSNDIYIGSTTKSLDERLQQHENDFKNGNYVSSQDILKQGNYKIILIKKFPCFNLLELEREETKHQRSLNCVNKKFARRNKVEYYNDNKELICKRNKNNYNKNRVKILSKQKKNYNDNKEVMRKRNKDNYNKHRENILSKQKKYYNDNKEKVLIKSKQRYEKNQIVLIEKNKQYYFDNKEKIAIQKKKIIDCACGRKYQHTSRSRHFKSLFHIKYVEEKK